MGVLLFVVLAALTDSKCWKADSSSHCHEAEQIEAIPCSVAPLNEVLLGWFD